MTRAQHVSPMLEAIPITKHIFASEGAAPSGGTRRCRPLMKAWPSLGDFSDHDPLDLMATRPLVIAPALGRQAASGIDYLTSSGARLNGARPANPTVHLRLQGAALIQDHSGTSGLDVNSA
jgi:hypothetical protein